MAYLNPFTGDLLPGQVYNGGGSGIGWSAEYATRDDFPTSTGSGVVVRAIAKTGTWWSIGRSKPAGLWQDLPTGWEPLPAQLAKVDMSDTLYTSLADNDLEYYDATAHQWKNMTPSAALTKIGGVATTDSRVIEDKAELTPSAGAAGTITLDLSLGRSFKIDCSTNSPTSLTVALSNVPAGTKMTALSLLFKTGAGALPTVTWPTGVTAPTLVASKTAWYTLATEDNGTTVRLFEAGSF